MPQTEDALLVRPITIDAGKVVATNLTDPAVAWSAAAYYHSESAAVSYNSRLWQSMLGTKRFIYSVSTTFDLIYAGDLGVVGDSVSFESTGTLPSPLTAATTYYIVEKGTSGGYPYIKVSATEGGSVINLTTTGSGDRYVIITPNVNNEPVEDSEYWLNVAPANTLAMYDDANTTLSTRASLIDVTLAPGARFDTIALLGMAGVSTIAISVFLAETTGNLFLVPNDFSSATWGKGLVTVTANTTAAPDGQTTADTMVEQSGTGSHTVFQNVSGLVAGEEYVLEVYIKASGRNKAYVEFAGAAFTGTAPLANIDLVAETAVPGGGAAASIDEIAPGWFLCRTSAVATASGTATIYIAARNAAGALSYAGIAANPALILWGAQFRPGTESEYYKEYDLVDTSFSNDWYADTYMETLYKNRFAASDIPPLGTTAKIRVQVSGPGDVSVGTLVVGLSKGMGPTTFAPEVGDEDYSDVDINAYGGVELVQRAYAPKGSFRVSVPVARADALSELLSSVRATRVLWLMLRDANAPGGWAARGIIYGLRTSFNCVIPTYDYNHYELNLLGLT